MSDHTISFTEEEIQAEMAKITEEDFIRELVVGYVITKTKIKPAFHQPIADQEVHVYATPIVMDDDVPGIGAVDLDLNEEIIAVIPAAANSYKILGLIPDNKDSRGGYFVGISGEYPYEFAGAYHPDWKRELAKKRLEKYHEQEVKKA